MHLHSIWTLNSVISSLPAEFLPSLCLDGCLAKGQSTIVKMPELSYLVGTELFCLNIRSSLSHHYMVLGEEIEKEKG